MESERQLVFNPKYLIGSAGISFVTCIFIFRWIGSYISTSLTDSYTSLPLSKRAEWNDRILSNVNATVAISLSLYTLLCDQRLYTDALWYDDTVARVACSIIVGYMIADILILLLWCESEKGELLGFMIHHSATIYGFYVVSVYGVLCLLAMLRLVAELSTPFMNQRWFFDTAGYSRRNTRVILNGFLMVLTFFVSRLLVMPVFWYQIYTVSGRAHQLGHLQLVLFVPGIFLDTLNIYWFSKMCKGFVKAVYALNKDNKID